MSISVLVCLSIRNPRTSNTSQASAHPRPEPPLTIPALRGGTPPRRAPGGAPRPAGVESSATRCHLSISFDTPWNGFSGDGERKFGSAASRLAVPDSLRSSFGDGGGPMPMSPRADAFDAREGWSRGGSRGRGERRDGRPFDGVCAWDEELGLYELEYGVSMRPTGDERGGNPVGDVLCFAKSRPY